MLAIGGDAGGGHTKLGITYTMNNTSAFAPLLVYNGTDSWELLSKLRTPDITALIHWQISIISHIYLLYYNI